jgi:hypothetical protein
VQIVQNHAWFFPAEARIPYPKTWSAAFRRTLAGGGGIGKDAPESFNGSGGELLGLIAPEQSFLFARKAEGEAEMVELRRPLRIALRCTPAASAAATMVEPAEIRQITAS